LDDDEEDDAKPPKGISIAYKRVIIIEPVH